MEYRQGRQESRVDLQVERSGGSAGMEDSLPEEEIVGIGGIAGSVDFVEVIAAVPVVASQPVRRN